MKITLVDECLIIFWKSYINVGIYCLWWEIVTIITDREFFRMKFSRMLHKIQIADY